MATAVRITIPNKRELFEQIKLKPLEHDYIISSD